VVRFFKTSPNSFMPEKMLIQMNLKWRKFNYGSKSKNTEWFRRYCFSSKEYSTG